METVSYIKPELLILVPVLYIVGMGIQKSKIKNNRIPLILGVIAILLSTLWVFSTSLVQSWQEAIYALYISITQGILAAGASVYAHQFYVQTKKKQ